MEAHNNSLPNKIAVINIVKSVALATGSVDKTINSVCVRKLWEIVSERDVWVIVRECINCEYVKTVCESE